MPSTHTNIKKFDFNGNFRNLIEYAILKPKSNNYVTKVFEHDICMSETLFYKY